MRIICRFSILNKSMSSAFVEDNKLSEIGIEKRGKQLRLLQLPEKTPTHLAITEQSFISVTSFSAQISANQGKPGILFIIGESLTL